MKFFVGQRVVCITKEKMSVDEWRSMDSAPRDGTKFDVKIKSILNKPRNCFHNW